mmetsp:Transcript_50619/g.120764  ORF Transcript_50619/g.120764 Transcript_50619/m.120764 type:complete len:88 (+) Transcript_50619:2858-3121(+)
MSIHNEGMGSCQKRSYAGKPSFRLPGRTMCQHVPNKSSDCSPATRIRTHQFGLQIGKHTCHQCGINHVELVHNEKYGFYSFRRAGQK